MPIPTSPQASQAPLNVVRGVVVSARRRTVGVRVRQNGGYGSVDDVPELWLRDATGQEHHVCGDGPLVDAREGHELALAWRPDGGLEGSANLTTNIWCLDRRADPERNRWADGGVGLPTSAVVGIMAGWVLAFLVLGIIGLLAMALVTGLTIKGAPARRAAFQARHAAVRAALVGHKTMAV